MFTWRALIWICAIGFAACDFGNYGPVDGGAQAQTGDAGGTLGDGGVAPDLSMPDLSRRDMSGAVSHDLATPDLALHD